MAAATRETPLSEMNITPLVDVMLVLLVIFMIAAPALTNTLTLKLPGVVDGPKPPPPTVLTLQVQSGDVFALDGVPMSRREIGDAVRAAYAAEPNLKVNLDVDAGAEYASAMTAMATVRNAGVEAIALVDP